MPAKPYPRRFLDSAIAQFERGGAGVGFAAVVPNPKLKLMDSK